MTGQGTAYGTQLRATAYHEAAHAVAFIENNRTFRYVTIKAIGGSGQVALWRSRNEDPITLAIVCAAGPIAERHIYPDRFGDIAAELADVTDWIDEGDDVFASLDTARFCMMIQDPASQITLWRHVERLVTGHWWPAIDAVAQRLLASTRALTYREVTDIVNPLRQSA